MVKLGYIEPDAIGKRSRFVLLEDVTSTNHTVTVPKGFVTDGVSVPRLLAWIVYPTGKVFVPAIIHDYALTVFASRKQADELFREECEAHGITSRSALCLYLAVRLYSLYTKMRKVAK